MSGLGGVADDRVRRPRARAGGRREDPRAQADESGKSAASADPDRIRRAVAVLVSRFPLITETFILREIDEMERQGQPVRLVPLIREEPEVIHDEALPWLDRALFTPFLSGPIVASNLRLFRRRPGRYLRTLFRILRGTVTSWNFLVRTLALFPKAVHLAERLEREGVRHLHAHFATHPTTVALVVSELTGIGFSFTAHAHDIFVRRQLLGTKVEAADFVRVVSRYNRDLLRDLYGDRSGAITVIPVGIDVDAYEAEREEARSVADPDRAEPLLLSVASLEPYKGLPHLIEACALLRDRGLAFRCEIVGTGPLRRRLEERIDRLALQDRVRLRGPLPQRDVAALLGRARAFVLPSVVADDGQMEGLPVSLMESMASGCPVVTTRLSGIPELVEDRHSGLLVEPGDPMELADALAEVLNDPGLADELAGAGRRAVAERHRIGPCVARLIERLDAVTPPAPEDLVRSLAGHDWPAGRRPEACGLRRLHTGSDSRVAELMVVRDGRVHDLVFKTHRSRRGESRSPQLRARREARMLRHLHDSGLAVPEPLCLDEDSGTLLMEACPGSSLEDLLRENRFRTGGEELLADACRKTGAWLHDFQALAPSAAPGPTGGPATHNLLERAAADVERCREAGLLELRGHEPIDWLRVLEEGIRPESRDPVPRHGDFWPGNVFVGDDSVSVVDFEGHGTGLKYEDVARFLAHMELYLAYPLLAGRRRRLASAFLEGYLQGQRFDEALFRFCGTVVAARMLARDLEADAAIPRLGRRHRRLLRTRLLGD